MAETEKKDDEPSIEEILDSIRQIISEDEEEQDDLDDLDEPEEEAVAPEPKMPPAPEPPELPELMEEPEPEEDIFDLTDKIEDEPEEAELEPEPEEDIASMEVDLVDSFDEPEEVELEPQVVPDPPVQEKYESDTDSILTSAAENAAFDAMSALVRKTAVEHNGITLEDIVRAELKPLLRAWLDRNLPIVIERLVREELERVSKRALDE